MKKHLLTLVLALTVCLQLALPAAAAYKSYRDVQDGHWSSSSVERAIDLGLFQGVTEEEFGWGQPMSRAAFAAALARLFDWEEVDSEASVFSDVTPDRWFYNAVETAYANGALPAGHPEFRPTDAITRGEMAAMLIRALGYTSLAGYVSEYGCPFSDVSTNKGFITIAYDMGLMSGVGQERFAPDEAATREQAAAVLVRVYDCLSARPVQLNSASAYRRITVETPKAAAEDAMPTTPLEPLTALYEALREMKETGVDMSRAALCLKAGGLRTLTGGGEILASGTLTAEEVERLLEREDVNTYFSERYQSAYCIYQPNEYQTAVVWYQSDESLAAKLQLARLFGVTRYTLE